MAGIQGRSALLRERFDECRRVLRSCDQEILVVRGLHRPRVARAQDRVAWSDQIRNAESGLRLRILNDSDSIIVIDPQARIQGEMPKRHRVLNVKRVLVDISSGSELERGSSAS
jgi:hypothetical protein